MTEILDDQGKTLLSLGCVVPEVLDIYNSSFGEFLHFKVDKNGYIKDWVACRKFDNRIWADIKEMEERKGE